MPIQNLLEKIKKIHPNADLDLIRLAFDFVKEAHGDKKRANGDYCWEHNLKIAKILTEINSDIPTILAGLLHDIPEDTKYSIEDLKNNFGEEIAALVESSGRLSKLKYRGIKKYAENLRKMFIAMAKDLRVIIIKFADRLHNLQTLEGLSHNKALRITNESLEIYAPIANRLGLGELKGKIEDAAFKYILPEEYKKLSILVTEEIKRKEGYLEEIKKLTKKNLTKHNIDYISVHGRTKDLYSLYKKLEKKKDIKLIYDIIAFRIIVENISDCYGALGVIHETWAPLKGRIKDYIAQPKPNGYQSLHTTVFTPQKQIIEFQIRTEQMHEEAEFGIAAHWHYKEKKNLSTASSKQTAWVKDLVKWQENIHDDKKYLESLKIDIFQNRIFVFTPKGDVINLIEGATPIDFAYYVHSQIGDTYTGALVNNQMASLDTELKSGDVVEIITDRNRKGPNPDWLNIVKTANAKGKIKTYLKKKKKF